VIPHTVRMGFSRVVILGCGYTGLRVLRLARSRALPVVVTLRSSEREAALRAEGAEVLVAPRLGAEIERYLGPDARVVIAFPADPDTDGWLAPRLRRAHSVMYISSTGVYGELRGRVDDHTLLSAGGDARVFKLRDAEDAYRTAGACVLRSPAIYGPDRGLHVRVLSGEHRIPGDGSHFISRVHAEDLAQFALSEARAPGEVFLVGDLEPARHIDVVRFICSSYGVPLPASAPIETLHASLRADRAVDASRALQQLAVTLRFPSYRQGMAPEATGLRRTSALPPRV
jgi:nucleoside-diphosphate-sugar epimerase